MGWCKHIDEINAETFEHWKFCPICGEKRPVRVQITTDELSRILIRWFGVSDYSLSHADNSNQKELFERVNSDMKYKAKQLMNLITGIEKMGDS